MSQEQCPVITATGEQCKNRIMRGYDRCYVHAVGVPATAGRPSLLTEEVAALLVASLRAGNYPTVASRAAGISWQTFVAWMQRGAKGEEPYAQLKEQVERARAEGQVRHVAIVSRAAESDWRASAWLLERQWPEQWGGVSVRVRAEAEPQPEVEELTDTDPFSEFDELAERRNRRAG
jgi:hypothetical protein